jgi:integrase
MDSRCLNIFENSIKTTATLKTFRYSLDTFLNWAKFDCESFLELEPVEIENLLQDYVMILKRRVKNNTLSSNSIPNLIMGVFKFLKSNRKKIDKESVTQLYPERVKPQGERAITDNEIRQLLEYADIREKAIIHIVSATGARPESIAELQMKYVTKYDDGYTKLVLYANDYKHETITFLHPEATTALDNWLEWRKANGEKIIDESYVISNIQAKNTHVTKKHGASNFQVTMNRLFVTARINRKKTGNRFDVATFGGFRKRFNTKLEMNPDISQGATQCFMDHTGYLARHYRKPTEDELLQEYKKASPSLMLSKELILKQQLEESQKENVEEKDKRIADLEFALRKQEIMLNELMKKVQ